MKVIRERNEEISGTSFWRQERGDALIFQLLPGKQFHQRQCQRVSARALGGSDTPPNLLPVKPSVWKCKMNTRLGTMFTLLLAEWTDACCSSDILAAGTALYALGSPALSMRRFHRELSLEF